MGKDQVEIEELSYVLRYIALPSRFQKLCSYSMNATVKRFKQGQSRPDLFSHFVQEDGQLHPDMTMKDLDAEVRAIIIAGELLHFTDGMRELNKFFTNRFRYLYYNPHLYIRILVPTPRVGTGA